jgi:hypothetical protein
MCINRSQSNALVRLALIGAQFRGIGAEDNVGTL